MLVVHRPRYDDWSFPKGKAEPGESDEDCAVREVEEETGLACALGRELPSTDYIGPEGRPEDGALLGDGGRRRRARFEHEVDEARWVSVDEAAELLSYERDVDVLRAAFDVRAARRERLTRRTGVRAASLAWVVDEQRLRLHDVPGRQVLRLRPAGAVRTSRSRSCRERRSACSGRTAPASRRCCGSWPGLEEPSSGVAELHPGATVGFLQQEPELDPAKDVRGNVEDGVRALRDLLDRFNAVSAAFAEPDADFDALLAEQATVQEQIDRHDAWGLDAALDRAMDALRLPEGDRDVTTLSGGERRRVALCRLLLSSPDLLLLDEPTNHLDAESVAWLERFLEDYKGTVMAVTHDRYFLDNVAGWILELDRGKGLPFEGNYSSWLEQKQARLASRRRRSRRGGARSPASSSGCA